MTIQIICATNTDIELQLLKRKVSLLIFLKILACQKIALPANTFLQKKHIFFTYPNAYHKFVSHFQNTYQHGGVSMEEMMVPFIVLQPKK